MSTCKICSDELNWNFVLCPWCWLGEVERLKKLGYSFNTIKEIMKEKGQYNEYKKEVWINERKHSKSNRAKKKD